MADSPHPQAVHFEGTLLRPWEEEETLQDHLYAWMERTPWLALSCGAHLVAWFVLAAIPWRLLQDEPVKIVDVAPQPPPEDPFEEPPEEPDPPLEDVVPVDAPVLVDDRSFEAPVDPSEDTPSFAEGPALDESWAPFEGDAFNDVLGIGQGARGGLGGGGLGGTGTGSRAVADAIEDGLDWLARHQAPDGSWDGDGFASMCGARSAVRCGDEGAAVHDVGLTALAVLSYLGVGHTPNAQGPYRERVARAVAWLRDQRDPDTGLVGELSTHESIYDHAIATLALAETYRSTRSPLLKQPVQDAVHFIQRARNPYGAWRYDVPPLGDRDTSVTGWMIFALVAARDAGIEVDENALQGGLAWIEEATDPASGRTGYDSVGSLSSRTVANEHFPREKGEAMTAVALLCRVFLGQDPDEHPILERQADLLARTPPEWDPEGLGCDMYYWYYGTYAMFQMGGRHWRAWERAMQTAVLDSQRDDGDAAGSWDPVGPWGHVGGRVYSTALMTLSLEVYFRHARLLGAR